MINDNSSVGVIMNVLSHKKNAYFLFDPEKSHYTNSMSIYRAIKKRVYERYYGQTELKKNKTHKNAFKSCTTPLDIFHRERNIKINIAQELSRIGYFVDKGYEINIMGDNRPQIKLLKEVIDENVQKFAPISQFKKPDYFLPVNVLHGLVSSEEWQKNGIEVLMLDNKLIYPFYGVWSPTSQEYLSLVDLYLKNLRNPEGYKNVMDLGWGTGVLSILAGKYGVSGDMIAIDSYKHAVECTTMNSQVHGLGTKIRALQLDLCSLYHNKSIFSTPANALIDRPSLSSLAFLEELKAYKTVAHQLEIPSKYDLIMWNPPWIPASKLASLSPLDNGVYDPDEAFLKSSINFARLHLSAGKVGRMLLVYSDLAEIIGLQEPDRVENLVHQAGLFVEEVYQIPMEPPKRDFDPLVNYKKEAKVQLFEIFKQ